MGTLEVEELQLVVASAQSRVPDHLLARESHLDQGCFLGVFGVVGGDFLRNQERLGKGQGKDYLEDVGEVALVFGKGETALGLGGELLQNVKRGGQANDRAGDLLFLEFCEGIKHISRVAVSDAGENN